MSKRTAEREALRVRMYDVRFGDAILVSVPEPDRTRHILIDVGNVQTGEGGATSVFARVIDDVMSELNGEMLDLYVMTHEHMDHVKGLTYAANELKKSLRARYAWLTGSADPDYGENFPEARKKRLDAQRAYLSAGLALSASPDRRFEALLLNNDFRATKKCVDYLRTIAETTAYIDRTTDLTGKHPFTEAKLTVWAPEADTSAYYGRFTPAANYSAAGAGPAASETPVSTRPIPPAGVDIGAFHRLLDWRANGHVENLYTIDRAENNTSVVFSIEWRGWTLLFAGDAELRSWHTMSKYGVLKPVHFLKVAHHGSSNATPSGAMLNAILPLAPHDGRSRHAVVSTCLETYSGVPDEATLKALKDRCTVTSVLDLGRDEFFFDVFLEDGKKSVSPAITCKSSKGRKMP